MRLYKHLFLDRADAGRQLRELLPLERMKSEEWYIVSVSAGGLFIASILNERIRLPLDILLSAAITAPQNPECELARVSETEEIVIHEALANTFDIQADYIYGEATRKHEEKNLSLMYQYRKGDHFRSLKDKNVLLVDEGTETGLKLMLAIKTAFAQKAKAVYVAVPVIPSEILEAIDPLVDELFYLHELEDYVDTSYYYKHFETIDEEIIETLLETKK